MELNLYDYVLIKYHLQNVIADLKARNQDGYFDLRIKDLQDILIKIEDKFVKKN